MALPRGSFLLMVAAFAAAASTAYAGQLMLNFYEHSCPEAEKIVAAVVAKAHAEDPRMAASLLRLHFHDCFVKGCDASVLLDSSKTVVSEKRSVPNRDSARGFEVVDEIKAALEAACPLTVSCADILTIAARDAVVLTGGPGWPVALGRRDSTAASISGSNHNIPAPNNTFPTILTKFKLQGLDLQDLVALSGSHTIGDARCTSFRQRLYNQSGNGLPDATLDPSAAAVLRQRCPRSGGDQTLFFLDPITPFHFDNQYFKNILAHRALLSSDEVLLKDSPAAAALVEAYAASNDLFFQHYVESIVKMGNISPLTGSDGEVRKNCRRVNRVHHY